MAESSGSRTIVTFGAGFLLGALFGVGGAVCGVQLIVGGDVPEPATAAVVEPATEPAVEAVEAVPAPEPVAAPAPAAPKAAPKPAAPKPAAPKPKPPPVAAAVAPAPAPAPPPAPAPVVLSAPSEVVFVGEDGVRHPANAVPPGTFEVLANWGSGLVKSGTITVKPNKPPKLVCDPATKTCTSK